MTKYGIIKINQLPKIYFSELHQTSFESSTKSKNKKKLIISFDIEPSFFNDIVFEDIFGRTLFSGEEVSQFPKLLPSSMINEWLV